MLDRQKIKNDLKFLDGSKRFGNTHLLAVWVLARARAAVTLSPAQGLRSLGSGWQDWDIRAFILRYLGPLRKLDSVALRPPLVVYIVHSSNASRNYAVFCSTPLDPLKLRIGGIVSTMVPIPQFFL